MFFKVNNEVGFNDQALTHWSYTLKAAEPAALARRQADQEGGEGSQAERRTGRQGDEASPGGQSGTGSQRGSQGGPEAQRHGGQTGRQTGQAGPAAQEETVARHEEGAAVTPQTGTPVITALQPAQMALESPSFTLHVQGSGFQDGSVIVWNGGDEATTFVSATELTTEVDMSTAGTATTLPVQVRNPDATASNTVDFTFTAAPAPPAPKATLTLYFAGGNELVLEGADADKVRHYFEMPSSHMTVL